jgi:hypothetical protein
MNAVKRCLAFFAVALVVAACGGDDTADQAGANLHIRATPGAVWTRHNSNPATILIDAVDNLGGNAEGSWSVGTVTGPMTVVLDTSYQTTSNGSLALASRFIITPTAAGEGEFVVNGTGGPVTVPVRIAPDTNAFAAVISDATPNIGDTITFTAPAGTRFTATTTVNFYAGAQTNTLQQGATPKIVSITPADSTVLRVIPPAGAQGWARITGIAAPSTPSLTSTARTSTSLATVDTKTLTGTYTTPLTGIPYNTAVTVTLTQPGYRFRTATSASSLTLPFPGSTMAGVVTVVNPDSLHITFFPPPGFANRAVATNLFNAAQSFYNLSLPFIDTLRVDSLPTAGLGQDDPDAGPVGVVTLPAMAVNDIYVFWDNGTYTAPDADGLGQSGSTNMYEEVVITTAGRYRFTYDWDGSADIDSYVLDITRTSFLGSCGGCTAHPEVMTTPATPLAAGVHVYVAATIWSGLRPVRVRVTVTRIA